MRDREAAVRTWWIIVAVGLALSPAGCSKDAPPGEPGRESAPAKGAASEPSTFQTTLQRVLMLEEAGQFAEALRLCQEMEQTFAKHPDRGKLAETKSRLMDEKRASLALANTINALGSDRAAEVKEARARLAEAGEAGAVLLRKAVRERSDKAAAEAARILAEKKDRLAVAILAQRIKDAPPEPLRSALLGGLKTATGHEPDGAVLRDLLAGLADDKEFRMAPAAEHLAWILTQRCGGNERRFNAILQDPAAAKKLQDYIARAVPAGYLAVSKEGELRSFATPLNQPGIHGQYYEGMNFEKLVFERQDRRIAFLQARDYGYPGGRETDLSIRWTGQVQVPKSGEYVFYVISDDGARLWIDDQMLLNDWTVRLAEERAAKVRLTEGLHALKLEYFQDGGPGSITFMWSGPGFGKQVITDKSLTSRPGEGAKKP